MNLVKVTLEVLIDEENPEDGSNPIEHRILDAIRTTINAGFDDESILDTLSMSYHIE